MSAVIRHRNAGGTLYGTQRNDRERLNAERVAIDLSHVGPQMMADALDASKQPCEVTHSVIRSLCDHVGNKTDVQIRAVAAPGDVFGLAPYA
ncbi:MAG: membrane dipeptidase, partial [Acidobacteria bacterium]|nr:membrane dipeptidase [Acidobacteriota bacterium]